MSSPSPLISQKMFDEGWQENLIESAPRDGNYFWVVNTHSQRILPAVWDSSAVQWVLGISSRGATSVIDPYVPPLAHYLWMHAPKTYPNPIPDEHGWFNSEDRLPAINTLVLAITKHILFDKFGPQRRTVWSDPFIAVLTQGSWETNLTHNHVTVDRWQPLPENPTL